jgi:hypothetical protein
MQAQTTQKKPQQQKTQQKNQIQRRRRRPNRRQRIRRRQTNVAANYNTNMRTFSDLKLRRDGTAIVSFCELWPIKNTQGAINSLIFINPSKWVGRRTQAQASLYSQFRPLRLKVDYIPTVGTATNGSVSFGAFYNSTFPTYSEDLAYSLPNSEGGFMCSAWSRYSTQIKCGTNLLQNQFGMSYVTQDDIPITLMTIAQGVNQNIQTIGYIAVSGLLHLSGPRTAPVGGNLSGNIKGVANYDPTTGLVTIDIPPENLSNVNIQQGDSFDALIQDNGLSPLVEVRSQIQRAINWGKIFGVFKKVACTVIKIAETAITVVAAIAPLFGVAAVRSTIADVQMEIIGRTTFPLDISNLSKDIDLTPVQPAAENKLLIKSDANGEQIKQETGLNFQ